MALAPALAPAPALVPAPALELSFPVCPVCLRAVPCVEVAFSDVLPPQLVGALPVAFSEVVEAGCAHDEVLHQVQPVHPLSDLDGDAEHMELTSSCAA